MSVVVESQAPVSSTRSSLSQTGLLQTDLRPASLDFDGGPAHADLLVTGADPNVVPAQAAAAEGPTPGRDRAAELAAELASCSPSRKEEVRNELVLLHLDAAETVARRYRGRGQDHQDLVQVARLGLVEAASRYDPALGPFLGFAFPTMLGVIRRHFRDRAWMVKLPRSTQEHSALLARAREDLAHTLMRWPTVAELATHLGLGEDEVRQARSAAGCFHVASLDGSLGERPEAYGLNLAEDEPGFDQIESSVAAGEACRDLSERDRRLVELRFYRQLSQRQIAAEFGVSQMQVSRWLTRLTAQLRRNLLGSIAS